MHTLDLIDRKILYHLDINSRQSNSQISRKVGIHKNVVTYRIHKLCQQGVIKNFNTIIDPFKLGFTSIKFLLTFHNAPYKKRQEIIHQFEKNKQIWYLAEVEGTYDLIINFWIHDLNEFNRYWEHILEQYRTYIKEYKIYIYIQTHHFLSSHLLREDYNISDRENHEIINAGDTLSIDDIDDAILSILSLNARTSIVDIAKQLNTTTTIIKYRINKLKEKRIIQGFRVDIDISKLGLHYYTLNIYLKSYKQRKHILSHIKINPLVKMIDISIGGPDLIVGIRSKDVTSIHKFINDIDNTFPNAIQYYNYFYFLNIKKLNFYPTK